MAHAKRGLEIVRNGHNNVSINLDPDEEVIHINSLVYVVKGDEWQSHRTKRVVFSYILQPGEGFNEYDLSADEELVSQISNMEKEDLDKIRNFCTVSGLIK